MIVEIKLDGVVWIKLDVKEPLAPEVVKEFETLYQKIISNKTGVNSSNMETRAVHQLRKKYG
jgi:hypothetical protein